MATMRWMLVFALLGLSTSTALGQKEEASVAVLLFQEASVWKGTLIQTWHNVGKPAEWPAVMTIKSRDGSRFRAEIKVDDGNNIRILENVIHGSGVFQCPGDRIEILKGQGKAFDHQGRVAGREIKMVFEGINDNAQRTRGIYYLKLGDGREGPRAPPWERRRACAVLLSGQPGIPRRPVRRRTGSCSGGSGQRTLRAWVAREPCDSPPTPALPHKGGGSQAGWGTVLAGWESARRFHQRVKDRWPVDTFHNKGEAARPPTPRASCHHLGGGPPEPPVDQAGHRDDPPLVAPAVVPVALRQALVRPQPPDPVLDLHPPPRQAPVARPVRLRQRPPRVVRRGITAPAPDAELGHPHEPAVADQLQLRVQPPRQTPRRPAASRPRTARPRRRRRRRSTRSARTPPPAS